jgi:Uma2 family endonuclease
VDDGPRTPLATYDDLMRLPEDVHGEVLDGVVRTLPGALPEHGRVQRSLSRYVGGPFDDDDGGGGPGGWWILIETDVRFSPYQIVRPDVVGWRRARLESPWGKRPIDTTPDWICEVVSPTSRRRDRIDKSRLYLASGVPHYWLVDPEERTLECYTVHDGYWLQTGVYEDSCAEARIPPFESVVIPVARLFPPVAPG